MVDPISAAGGAVVLGWAGKKVLGPTLDQIGDDLKQRYGDWRMENASRIAKNAAAKIRPGKENGIVAPRVAMRVLDDGSWTDAAVMAEYFGGILAASRSEDGRDDRGSSWAGLVSRLSTYDVYLHYLAYDAFRRLHVGRDPEELKLGMSNFRERARVYLPAYTTLAAMGLEVDSSNWLKLAQAMTALIREDLVGEYHRFGPLEFVREEVPNAPDMGVVFTPSVPGIELFLWAHGHADCSVDAVLDADLPFEPVEDLGHVESANTVAAMKEAASENPPTSS